MSVYGYKENKCKEEVVTLDDFNNMAEHVNNNVFSTADFAVLEGNVTTAALGSDESVHYNDYTLDFPSGFDKDNCVCVAFGISTLTDKVQGYSYEILTPANSGGGVRSSLYRNIILGATNNLSKITMSIGTIFTGSHDIRYKIVLMKVKG